MTDVVVTPPDASVWWDPAAVTASALARLRIGAGDVDAGRVAALVDPAGQNVNAYLDRPAAAPSPVPAVWADAVVTVVVDMYTAQSVPASSELAFPGYLVTDPLRNVRTALAPWKQRAGMA